MELGVAQVGLVSPLPFSLYANDIPTSYRHVELAQYEDNTVAVSTSCDPWVLFGCVEVYPGRPEHCLRDWRIAINVSKSSTVVSFKAARRI
jgi:hypothetical protein